MGTLAKFGKVSIVVKGNDHLPPHFHAKGTDFEALIAIETLEVIAGDLPATFRKEVLTWAAANKAALVAEWSAWNPNIPFA